MVALKTYAPRVYTWVDFTPVVDTSAYAQNDILWIPAVVTNGVWKPDAIMKLEQVIVTDVDDDSALDLVLYFSDNASFSLGGAVNAAFGPDDTNAARVCARVAIGNASFVDIGGAKQAVVAPSQATFIKPVAGTRDFYCGATYTNAVTPTYASASDIKLRFCLSS